MKKLYSILLLALAIIPTIALATTIEEAAKAVSLAKKKQSVIKEFVPTRPRYPVAEPTGVYTSISRESVAKIPAIIKVDRLPVGLLKWTAAIDRPGDPVIGYEIQRDSGNPVNIIYTVTETVTEFPFNAGMWGMIITAADEFWKVRAVFSSGARSAWAISQTWPERTTLNY